MRVEELRIGNYYIDEDGEESSVSVRDFGLMDWRLCEPIPLTEEWLIKFGFGAKYKSVHNHWNFKGFGLDQKSDVDEEHNSVEQEQVFYYDYRIDVKYVHQLQNLYYALTGEELTLQH